MQPASKTSQWNASSSVDNEPPTKVQAIELPEGESDDEYEMVPKKAKKETATVSEGSAPVFVPPRVPAAVPAVSKVVEVVAEDVPADSAAEILPPVAPDATDDDWLRSRTNRLLDLVAPEDIAEIAVPKTVEGLPGITVIKETAPVLETKMDVNTKLIAESKPEADDAAELTDATMDAIRKNGRLFVRNLPYTASEDELRKHFEKYGALEEVRLPCLLSFSLLYLQLS
jgi:multiple RNA-binding domain-containing protein 1